MALKAMLFVLASVLLVTSKVSSDVEELLKEAIYANVPTPAPVSPVKAPASAPAPPVKAPVAPPIVKAPITPPPVYTPVVPAPPTSPVRPKQDCPPLCAQRCKLHSRQKICLRACITCCDRCKCVPPGTYGNREKCGKCYTGMTTHGNRIKCP